VWGVDHGNYTLLALSKNYQVHHVGDTLHYVFDPFYVTAGQELRVIFYGENEIDSTTYVVGNSSCCMKAIKLVATEATPIFGGVINNTGEYAYSGATVWQAAYEAHIVKSETNPEQPVTIMLRATKEYSVSNADATWTWRYATHIPGTSMADLIDNAQIAEGKPILTPLCIFDYGSVDNTPVFGGYMVTLPRKNADIMAAKWATLVAYSGVNAVPDVTYLS
jgi:hypothetical protein